MPVALICQVCGMEFNVSPYYARRGQRFCSLSCAGQSGERSSAIVTKCAQCGTTVRRNRNKMRRNAHNFCSLECYRTWWLANVMKSGAENARWLGGRDRDYAAWTGSQQARLWRQSVRAKYRGQCACCAATVDLHCHHIRPFREFPELREDPDNGVLLCRSCHTRAHAPVKRSRRVVATPGAVIPSG